jgi:hypothetical protein
MDEQTENRNLPVLASEARVIEPQREPSPLAAPVVVATGGLLAGIGAFVLARVLRHSIERPRAVRIGRGRRGAKLDIAASRSFLVDVHVLNNRR